MFNHSKWLSIVARRYKPIGECDKLERIIDQTEITNGFLSRACACESIVLSWVGGVYRESQRHVK